LKTEAEDVGDKRNNLQTRIGGPVATLDANALIESAREALEKLKPIVVASLEAQRDELRALLAAAELDSEALYRLAHDARGLAGTFGYGRLGAIADAFSRYVCACRDAGASPDGFVLRILAQAMERSYVKDDEGGALLNDLSTSARALSEAKSPKAA
jgi:hypothetical protein